MDILNGTGAPNKHHSFNINELDQKILHLGHSDVPKTQRIVSPHKLSKRTLFSLPEGRLLVSNLIVGPGLFDRAFVEHVAPLQRREKQWGRIVSAGANQRLCYVYVDRDAFLADYINKFSHVEVK